MQEIQTFLEPVFLAVPDPYRGFVQGVAATLFVVAAIAFLFNPILELASRIVHGVDRIRDWIRGWGQGGDKGGGDSGPLGERGQIPPAPPETTIWERFPATPVLPIQPHQGGMPIIAVANLKGGVGKTTLSANLSAFLRDHYRSKAKSCVLSIDFDYQNNLTQTLLGETRLASTPMSAHAFLLGQNTVAEQVWFAKELHESLRGVSLAAADYPLATVENDVLVEWVQLDSRSEPAHDLRYRLCRTLRDEAFQSKYAAVVIDLPPRLTASAINALCAATHLIVPTAMDAMSRDATAYFLQQIRRLQASLFPALNIIGVLPTLVAQHGQLNAMEAGAVEDLNRIGRTHFGRDAFVLDQLAIPRKAEISQMAGTNVAYLRRRSSKQIFEAVGQALLSRLT